MNTRKTVYSGVFIALGIIIPQIFHYIGGPALGSIILPMHLPVIVAGFICGPLAGVLTGILTPVLSSTITGMPPVPKLWFMIIELAAYGGLSGLLYFKMKMNIILSLILSMIAGRIIYGGAFIIAVNLFGINLPPALGVTGALIKGIPGIILQLILIPVIIVVLERNMKNGRIKNIKRKTQ